MKKNKFKLNILGFTIVELLAMIVLLSIIVTVIIYFIIDIINNANRKSYEVTVNNIEIEVVNYISEDIRKSSWITDNDKKYQYQCVSVQDLIDAGYFKGDVLNSKVSENRPVYADDYVYIERDSSTKTITKSIFLGINDNIGLCNGYNVVGEISFNVSPSGWQKEKNITINYKLLEYDNLENYTYDYVYEPVDGSKVIEFDDKNFNTNSQFEILNVKVNGLLRAMIKNKNGKVVLTRTQQITKIDNTPPVIVCNKKVAQIEQTIENSTQKYILKYDVNNESIDSCSAYIEYLVQKDGGALPNVEDVFIITDNSQAYGGVINTKYGAKITNEHQQEIDALRRTCCNCDDGYCKWAWTVTAFDEAMNSSSETFIYYTKYDKSLNYCKGDNPKLPNWCD